jgi:hypothetical protein
MKDRVEPGYREHSLHPAIRRHERQLSADGGEGAVDADELSEPAGVDRLEGRHVRNYVDTPFGNEPSDGRAERLKLGFSRTDLAPTLQIKDRETWSAATCDLHSDPIYC